MSDWVDRSSADMTTGTGDSISMSDPQLMFLEELVEEHAMIAGDVIEIGAHTWAIHGFIAVDGDVILAEYDTEEHARIALNELSTAQDRAGRG
jgi:hypothetical protein